MRICVDPGHGQDNRRPGTYDPGACHVEDGHKFEEASIALEYANELARIVLEAGHDAMVTRDAKTPCPVWKRAPRAELWKADVLVSLHVNDADSDTANGTETLWRRPESIALAREVQHAVVEATGFRDRGVKQRPDLSVLAFKGPAILIELGFIAHDDNRRVMLNSMTRTRVCHAIADAIIGWKGKK